jgi:PAS domain S-box-containing protein
MKHFFQSQPARLGLVAILTLVYVIAFLLAYPSIGRGVGALFVLPVVGAAWFIGLKFAVCVWLFGFPLQTLLFHLVGESGLDALFRVGGIPGTFAALVVSIVVGYLHDIRNALLQELARHKHTTLALRQSENFVRRITEATQDFVYVYDLEAERYIYTNQNLRDFLDFRSDTDVEGEHHFFLKKLHHDNGAGLIKQQQRYATVSDGDIIEVEYRILNAKDEWRWFYCREIVFSRSSSASPTQILGTAHDITERKLAAEMALEKEKLQIALLREQELVQFKNQFMSVISHEFRTPLAVIQSSSEILDGYFERLSPQRRADCVGVIKAQIQHVTTMLDDVSLVVADDTQYLERKPVLTDLEQFCRQIVSDLALAKGIEMIRFHAQQGLPCVPVDPRLLKHCLVNILSNAIKYSPAGSPVDFKLDVKSNGIIFVVQDYGIGIPECEQTKIYDTFFRASNVGTISGTGLGLRIVRDYVKLHGGTIDLQSEEGKGTTVTLHLPIGDSAPT